MRNAQPTAGPLWWSVTLTGAVTGAGLTFTYALVFALYAVLRSSFVIWTLIPPEVDTLPTLAANGASIVVASIAAASLLAIAMALLGVGTAMIINWLLAVANSHHTPARAILIGATATIGIVALCQLALHLALEAGLGRSLFSLGAETYLFWVGLPGLLHIGAGALGAWRLNLGQTRALQAPSSRRAAVTVVEKAPN
jgi:hypothetical protein